MPGETVNLTALALQVDARPLQQGEKLATAAADRMGRSFVDAEKRADALEAGLKGLANEQRLISAAFEKTTRVFDRVAQQGVQLDATLKTLGGDMKAVTTATTAMAKGLDLLAKESAESRAGVDRLGNEFKELKEHLRAAKAESDALSQSLDKSTRKRGGGAIGGAGGFAIGRAAGGFAQGALSSGGAGVLSSAVGFGAAGVGLAGGALVGVGIKRSLDTFAEFDGAMAELRAVTRGTKDELALMEHEIRKLGATTRFTALEAAQGAIELSRAGFSPTETTQALPATLGLAQAGGIGVGLASEITGNALRQYRLEASEAVRVTDALVTAADASNTEVDGMGASLSRAGTSMSALGETVETTAALLGILANAGIKNEIAGTKLTSSIAALLKPTESYAEGLADLGLKHEDLNIQTHGVVEVFRTLADAGLDPTSAIKIFGRENYNASLAITSLIDELDELLERLDRVKNSGATKKTQDIRGDAQDAARKEAASALEGLSLSVGEFFAPVEELALRAVTNFSNKLTGKEELTARNRLLLPLAIFGPGNREAFLAKEEEAAIAATDATAKSFRDTLYGVYDAKRKILEIDEKADPKAEREALEELRGSLLKFQENARDFLFSSFARPDDPFFKGFADTLRPIIGDDSANSILRAGADGESERRATKLSAALGDAAKGLGSPITTLLDAENELDALNAAQADLDGITTKYRELTEELGKNEDQLAKLAITRALSAKHAGLESEALQGIIDAAHVEIDLFAQKKKALETYLEAERNEAAFAKRNPDLFARSLSFGASTFGATVRAPETDFTVDLSRQIRSLQQELDIRRQTLGLSKEMAAARTLEIQLYQEAESRGIDLNARLKAGISTAISLLRQKFHLEEDAAKREEERTKKAAAAADLLNLRTKTSAELTQLRGITSDEEQRLDLIKQAVTQRGLEAGQLERIDQLIERQAAARDFGVSIAGLPGDEQASALAAFQEQFSRQQSAIREADATVNLADTVRVRREEIDLLGRTTDDVLRITTAREAEALAAGLSTDAIKQMKGELLALAEVQIAFERDPFRNFQPDRLEEFGRALGSNLIDPLEQAAIRFESLGDIGKGVLETLQQAFVQQAFAPLRAASANLLGDLFSGLPTLFSAKGNVFDGYGMPVEFAQGGIIPSRKDFFLPDGRRAVAGEAGPEVAIAPLERMAGGDLGVNVSGVGEIVASALSGLHGGGGGGGGLDPSVIEALIRSNNRAAEANERVARIAQCASSTSAGPQSRGMGYSARQNAQDGRR